MLISSERFISAKSIIMRFSIITLIAWKEISFSPARDCHDFVVKDPGEPHYRRLIFCHYHESDHYRVSSMSGSKRTHIYLSPICQPLRLKSHIILYVQYSRGSPEKKMRRQKTQNIKATQVSNLVLKSSLFLYIHPWSRLLFESIYKNLAYAQSS